MPIAQFYTLRLSSPLSPFSSWLFSCPASHPDTSHHGITYACALDQGKGGRIADIRKRFAVSRRLEEESQTRQASIGTTTNASPKFFGAAAATKGADARSPQWNPFAFEPSMRRLIALEAQTGNRERVTVRAE
uniref:Uncharacterized protein n=1 Tax=Lotharella oceanica TaxID=641309 RepID=A0A7S2U2P4_9EUKA|mmetsp:Transcript_7636/g.14953  ORF Transcript_7636/g.14953 Transcript_7636/m.14953 type:complete len:133 (+) Transcript_7636:118-516(+)